MSKKMDYDSRVRNHCVLLYPDCEEHINAFDKIMTDERVKVCGILHNRDEYNEDTKEHKAGDLKKEHWHLVIEYDNSISRSALGKRYGIKKECFEPCQNVKAAKRYLLHLDNDDKVLYSVSEVFGNNRESVVTLVKEKGDINLICPEIFDFIENRINFVSTSDVARFCCVNHYMGYYRNCAYIINRIIDEHNKKIQDKFEIDNANL